MPPLKPDSGDSITKKPDFLREHSGASKSSF